MCLLLLLAALVGAMSGATASAQEKNHAALVIDFGDGRLVVRVVSFSEETLSGAELLLRSGLDVALMTSLGGSALCAVEDVGCPPTPRDCFCQCRGVPCYYWSYFHLQDGAWVYSPIGADIRWLRDGDVDGWVWGDGQVPPPILTWEEIWALAEPLPSTATSPPAPSDTPRPLASTATVLLPSTFSPTSVSTDLPIASRPTATLSGPTTATAVPATSLPVVTSTASAELPAGEGGGVTPSPLLAFSPSTSGKGDVSSSSEPGGGIGGGVYSTLVFGGMVVILLAAGLWVRRRRK